MPARISPEVARRYAVTLLDAAREAGVAAAVARDLEGLQATLSASPELRGVLENRLLDGDVVARALTALFDGKVRDLTRNFLRLVAERRRAHLLTHVVDTALALLDERAGTAQAEVRSAVALTSDQVERLQARLSAYTGRRVQVQARVDPGLRGGLVARVGDLVFDGSIDTQLARLRQRLGGATVVAA